MALRAHDPTPLHRVADFAFDADQEFRCSWAWPSQDSDGFSRWPRWLAGLGELPQVGSGGLSYSADDPTLTRASGRCACRPASRFGPAVADGIRYASTRKVA